MSNRYWLLIFVYLYGLLKNSLIKRKKYIYLHKMSINMEKQKMQSDMAAFFNYFVSTRT